MKSKYPTPTLIPTLQTDNEDGVNRSQFVWISSGSEIETIIKSHQARKIMQTINKSENIKFDLQSVLPDSWAEQKVDYE